MGRDEPISRDEFIEFYAAGNGISVAWLLAQCDILPCDCDSNNCRGWQARTKIGPVSSYNSVRQTGRYEARMQWNSLCRQVYELVYEQIEAAYDMIEIERDEMKHDLCKECSKSILNRKLKTPAEHNQGPIDTLMLANKITTMLIGDEP